MNASKCLNIYNKTIKESQRIIDMIHYFEQNKNCVFELLCREKYVPNTEAPEIVVAKVIGYNKEGISISFMASEYNDGIGLRFIKTLFKSHLKSIKFKEILKYKVISEEDMPLYVGMKYINEEFSTYIKGLKRG